MAYLLIILVVLLLIGGEIKNSKGHRRATKRCQHCGKMIPFNATTCPYCYRDPGVDFGAEGKAFFRESGSMLKIILIGGVVILILLLLV